MYYKNVDKKDAPRVLHRRTQSARETYHPAITDLSEQALRITNGFGSDEETCIYPLTNGHHSERCSRLDLTYDDVNRPDDIPAGRLTDINGANHTNDLPPSRPPSIRVTTRLPKVHDDGYRERVCLSAHNRFKIGAFYRRPKSVEIGRLSSARSPRSIPSGYSYTDLDNNDFAPPNFLIRNSTTTASEGVVHPDTKKDPDDVPHRPQNKGRQPGTQLSNGCEEKANGFHQHLVNKHPLLKQKISRWITNGFKIQSLRSKTNRNLPNDRRPSSERLTWSRGSRRRISEHNLVEDMKRIKLRQQNLNNDGNHYKTNDWSLTSSLTITNLTRDPSLTNSQNEKSNHFTSTQ